MGKLSASFAHGTNGSRAAGPLGLLGVGALIALAVVLIRDVETPVRPLGGRPGATVALWVADRDAGAVYGLDRELILSRRVPLDGPIAIAACRDGGAWVLRSTEDRRGGRSVLARVSPGGSAADRLAIDGGTDVVATEDDDAIVLAGAGSESRVVRFVGRGAGTVLLRRNGIVAIACSGDRLAVGTARGEVLLVDPGSPGSEPTTVDAGGRVVDLARGPGPGSFWILVDAGSARLLLLGAGGGVEWSEASDVGDGRVVPCADAPAAWIVGCGSPRILKVGRGRQIDLALPETVDRPFGPAASMIGGIVVASPGGLLRMDVAGRRRPGQGGFAFVVDLDPVPPGRTGP